MDHGPHFLRKDRFAAQRSDLYEDGVLLIGLGEHPTLIVCHGKVETRLAVAGVQSEGMREEQKGILSPVGTPSGFSTTTVSLSPKFKNNPEPAIHFTNFSFAF